MADSNDLRTFYKGDLEPRLVRLDRKRREIARGIYIASAVGLILAGIGFWLSIVMKFNPIAGVAIPIVLTGLVAFFLLKSKWTDYLNGFKKQVIAPIVEFIDPALDYSADRHIRESTFKKSGIFRGRIDRYHGDDLVSPQKGDNRRAVDSVKEEKVCLKLFQSLLQRRQRCGPFNGTRDIVIKNLYVVAGASQVSGVEHIECVEEIVIRHQTDLHQRYTHHASSRLRRILVAPGMGVLSAGTSEMEHMPSQVRLVPVKYFILTRIYHRSCFCKFKAIPAMNSLFQNFQRLGGLAVARGARKLHEFMRAMDIAKGEPPVCKIAYFTEKKKVGKGRGGRGRR